MTPRIPITRRNFMLGTAATGATLLLPTTHALGANERLRVGIIGCGSRGTGHVGWVDGCDGAEAVAVSDPDKRRMNKAADKAKRDNIKKYQDYRQLLEDDDIDAVAIASCNHWHALHAIHACQAGKDVYVEKPASHSIWEGRKMVEAAHKYNRIVQVGTQQRSDPALIETRQMLEEGELGDVQWIHSLWYAHRGPIGKTHAPQSIHQDIDYNLWCGPRPNVPVRRQSFHYDWHWFWRYGNADMGNRVIHNIDDIHHVMRMGDEIPTRVMSVGGRFKYDDDATTPNTQFMLMDWKVPIIFGSRNMPLVNPRTGEQQGAPSFYERFGQRFRFVNLIKCEEGFIGVSRGGGAVYDNDGERLRGIDGDGGEAHMQNWVDAIRSGEPANLNAPIEGGHQSSVMLHTGNISYQIGQPAEVDKIREEVGDYEEAEETLNQMIVHLKLNGVDLEREKPTLGPWLNYDPSSERFTGDGGTARTANLLVRESYRRPFEVPEEV